jgi:hypothetical protein
MINEIINEIENHCKKWEGKIAANAFKQFQENDTSILKIKLPS